MKRSIRLLVVMALLVLVLAVPAFADPGGGGHLFYDTSNPDCSTGTCNLSFKHAGPGPGGNGGGGQLGLNGLQTVDVSKTDGQPATGTVNTRGGAGGPGGGGGGNCTTTFSPDSPPSTSGNGSLC